MTDTDRPLVTFALFAYNQEKYIREAVEGAFAQTYEPLEIILSDDCSSDQTFEIMQEMAAAYSGPHEVRVRQSEVNRGTLSHIIDVAHLSSAEIMLVAAGDDISLPSRSCKIARSFHSTEMLAAYSNCNIIDHEGRLLNQGYLNSKSRKRKKYGVTLKRIHGATAAYRPTLIRSIPPPESKILFEDIVFELLIFCSGGHIEYIEDNLTLYRHHESNVSVRDRLDSLLTEDKMIDKRKLYAEALTFFCDQVFPSINVKLDTNSKILNSIRRYSTQLFVLAEWRAVSRWRLIKVIIWPADIKLLKPAVARFFGWHAVLHLRSFRDFWRRS